jgi:hypothetical protein
MEVVFQTKLIEHFRRLGFWAEKIEFKGIAGCPDLLIAKDGRVSTWIEVKWNRFTLSPLQKHTITKMIDAGFHVICLSVEGSTWKDARFTLFDHVTLQPLQCSCKRDELVSMIYGP